jgi:hypothetical protein
MERKAFGDGCSLGLPAGGSCEARCPKDESHNRFATGVTVAVTWVVNCWGTWVSTLDDGEEVVIDPPSQGNAWFCYVCGAEAVVGDYSDDGPDIGPDP